MLSSRSFAIHDEYVSSTHIKQLVSKTPGRTLKGRAGLQENVLMNGSLTTNPIEKKANLKTPFRKGNEQIITKDAPASTKTTTVLPNRPLIDKTPAPNRLQTNTLSTPLNKAGKVSKVLLPSLIDEEETQSPAQPPSSSRKKLRVPRSSNSNKVFETPITAGDHWNVSDISIELSSPKLDGVEECTDEPDYSDPEYMPPKVQELPFEMPFELPDYAEVGKTLLASAHSYPVGTTSQFSDPDADEFLKVCEWPKIAESLGQNDESSDDDVFGPSKKAIRKPTATTIKKAGPSRLTSIPRPIPSAAPRNGPTKTKVPSRTAVPAPTRGERTTVPRPGTSIGTARRAPVVRPMTSASTTRRTPALVPANRPATRLNKPKKARPADLVLTFEEENLELPGEDFRFSF